VRERGGRERGAAASPVASRVDVGDEGQLAVREHGTLRCAGRARSEDDRDRTIGIVVDVSRVSTLDPEIVDAVRLVDDELRRR
jgi:hypothetical protein